MQVELMIELMKGCEALSSHPFFVDCYAVGSHLTLNQRLRLLTGPIVKSVKRRRKSKSKVPSRPSIWLASGVCGPAVEQAK